MSRPQNVSYCVKYCMAALPLLHLTAGPHSACVLGLEVDIFLKRKTHFFDQMKNTN